MKGIAARALARAAPVAPVVALSVTSCDRAVPGGRANALPGNPGRRGNAESVTSAARQPGAWGRPAAKCQGRSQYPGRPG